MLRTLLLSVAAGFLSAQAAPASLLMNGSFEEAPDEPGLSNRRTFEDLLSGRGRSWDIWERLPGWTTLSGSGIEIQSDRTLRAIDADDGLYYVELDSKKNSSVYQDVVLEAGRYALEFSYAPRKRNFQTNAIQYSIGSLVDEWVTGPIDDQFPWGQWTRVRTPFEVVAPGMYRITFAAGGTSDSFGGLLDRVGLFEESDDDVPTSIPVPAGLVLLASAVGGLYTLRRKSAPRRG